MLDGRKKSAELICSTLIGIYIALFVLLWQYWIGIDKGMCFNLEGFYYVCLAIFLSANFLRKEVGAHVI